MTKNKIIPFGLLLLARIAGAASLFAVNLLIVRFLGFEALASYAIFVSLVSISAILISSGFIAITPMFTAEYTKRKQPKLLKGFVRTALTQGGIIVSILALILLLFWSLGDGLPINLNLEMTVGVLITATATALVGFNGAILIGMKKQVAALMPETLLRPLAFLTFSVLLLANGIISTVSEIYWLLAFSTWLTVTFIWIRDKKIHKSVFIVSQLKDESRWRNASLPWAGITLLWDFMIDLVLLFTSIFAGSVEIAILHICFRYRVLAGFGMRVIQTLLMPEITESAVGQDREELKRKLFQVNLASLVYSVGVMAIFALLGKWLLGIFSTEAVSALPILLIVSVTMVIRAVFGPAPLLLAINNCHKTTLVVSFFCVIIALGIIGLTIPLLGITAAAISYTVANFTISGILWYLTKKKIGIDSSIFASFKYEKKLKKPTSLFLYKNLVGYKYPNVRF